MNERIRKSRLFSLFMVVLSAYCVIATVRYRSEKNSLPETSPEPALTFVSIPSNKPVLLSGGAPSSAPVHTPAPEVTPEPMKKAPVPVTVNGVETESSVTVLDLSKHPVEDIDELTSELSALPELKTLYMLECELSDKDAERLMETFPDLKLVWVTHVASCGVRTDTTYFSLYNPYSRLWNNNHLDGLRYCKDIVALDLGRSIATLESSAWYLSEMPHLKYLILYMAQYREIPELADLKELEYLELMNTEITDLSPLLECDALKHLNISNSYFLSDKDQTLDILCQLKTLKRLWISEDLFSEEQDEMLDAALSETTIYRVQGHGNAVVTEGGWRTDPSYFEMRDALHMYYMTDDGNVQPVNPHTGEPSPYENTNPFGTQNQ